MNTSIENKDKYLSLGIKSEILQDHLNTLFQAIKEVKEKHLWFYVDKEEKTYCVPQVERTFTYELYRQWANLLETKKNEYCINSEVQKKFSDDIQNGLMNCTVGLAKKYPDFVLHKAQNSFEMKNQLFLCEVKRTEANEDGIKKDFHEFCDFLSKDFSCPFALAIFITIGCDIIDAKTLNHIKDTVEDNKQDLANHPLVDELKLEDRILLVCYNPKKTDSNSESCKLTFNSLSNYIQKQKPIEIR